MPKVTVNAPGVPEGDPVEVQFLGVFANGDTHDVTDEQVAAWEALTGLTFPKDGLDPFTHTRPDPAPVYDAETGHLIQVEEAAPETASTGSKSTKKASAPVEPQGGTTGSEG